MKNIPGKLYFGLISKVLKYLVNPLFVRVLRCFHRGFFLVFQQEHKRRHHMFARPLFPDMGRTITAMLKRAILIFRNRDIVAVISPHSHPVLVACL